MNYSAMKTYIQDELVSTYSDTTFTRWGEIVNGWLNRDQVNNNLVVQSSVTPTTNPFYLDSGAVDEVQEVWILDGSRSVQLTPTSSRKLREYQGATGVGPKYYRVLANGQIEVQPYAGTGYTFYYTAVSIDSVMTGASDQTQALQDQPGLVIAAYKRCAYRYNKDPEGVAQAEQDYMTELSAYQLAESVKAAGPATVSSGAWSWD